MRPTCQSVHPASVGPLKSSCKISRKCRQFTSFHYLFQCGKNSCFPAYFLHEISRIWVDFRGSGTRVSHSESWTPMTLGSAPDPSSAKTSSTTAPPHERPEMPPLMPGWWRKGESSNHPHFCFRLANDTQILGTSPSLHRLQRLVAKPGMRAKWATSLTRSGALLAVVSRVFQMAWVPEMVVYMYI